MLYHICKPWLHLRVEPTVGMERLETEEQLDREQVAAFLREIADEIERPSAGRNDAASVNLTSIGATDWKSVDGERQPSSSEVVTESENRQTTGTGPERTPDDEMQDIGPQASDPERDSDGEDESNGPKELTFIAGGDATTLAVPGVVDCDVAVESRSRRSQSGHDQKITIELSWTHEDG